MDFIPSIGCLINFKSKSKQQLVSNSIIKIVEKYKYKNNISLNIRDTLKSLILQTPDIERHRNFSPRMSDVLSVTTSKLNKVCDFENFILNTEPFNNSDDNDFDDIPSIGCLINFKSKSKHQPVSKSIIKIVKEYKYKNNISLDIGQTLKSLISQTSDIQFHQKFLSNITDLKILNSIQFQNPNIKTNQISRNNIPLNAKSDYRIKTLLLTTNVPNVRINSITRHHMIPKFGTSPKSFQTFILKFGDYHSFSQLSGTKNIYKIIFISLEKQWKKRKKHLIIFCD